MITPEVKDEILNLLCNGSIEFEAMYQPKYNQFLEELENKVLKNEFIGILQQFQRYGLISRFVANSGTFNFILHVEALDLINRGGFVAIEKLLQDNIKKLDSEIKLLSKDLEPKSLEKANFILSLGQTILSSIALMK